MEGERSAERKLRTLNPDTLKREAGSEWILERELAKLDPETLESLERLLEETAPPTRALKILLEEEEEEGL